MTFYLVQQLLNMFRKFEKVTILWIKLSTFRATDPRVDFSHFQWMLFGRNVLNPWSTKQISSLNWTGREQLAGYNE